MVRRFMTVLWLAFCTPVFGADLYSTKLPAIETDATLDMADYRGNVLLVVNTASKCGFVSQLTQLEAIYQTYRARGLVVIGFPSNSFLQEFSEQQKTRELCRFRFGVTFPLAALTDVKGENANLVYQYLVNASPVDRGEDVKWNFEKFIVGRDGKVTARFASAVKPDDPQLIAALEAALAAEAPQ